MSNENVLGYLCKVRINQGRYAVSIPAELKDVVENYNYLEAVKFEDGILYRPVKRS